MFIPNSEFDCGCLKLGTFQGKLRASGGAVPSVFAVQPSRLSAAHLNSSGRLHRMAAKPGALYDNLLQITLQKIRDSNLRLFAPYTYAHNGRLTEGIHYLIPHLPGESGVTEELKRCAAFAQDKGAIVGLGGTLSAGGRGIQMAKWFQGKLVVVAGGSGTAFALVLGLLDASRRMKIHLHKSTLVMVGVGEVLTKMLFLLLRYEQDPDRFNFEASLVPRAMRPRLGKLFKKIILVNATNTSYFRTIRQRLQHEFDYSFTDTENDRIQFVVTDRNPVIMNAMLGKGDVSVTATSAGAAEEVGVDNYMLKLGSLVIDPAKPYATKPYVPRGRELQPYLRIDGAILSTHIRVEGEAYKFIGTGGPTEHLACFSDLNECAWRGITSSPEVNKNFSILGLENTVLSMIANGFRLAPFQSFAEPLDYKEFGRMKRLRRELVVQEAIQKTKKLIGLSPRPRFN